MQPGEGVEQILIGRLRPGGAGRGLLQGQSQPLQGPQSLRDTIGVLKADDEVPGQGWPRQFRQVADQMLQTVDADRQVGQLGRDDPEHTAKIAGRPVVRI